VLVAGELIGMQATPEPAYAGQWVPAPRRCVCSACLGCRLDRLKDLSAFFSWFSTRSFRPLPVHYYIWVYLPKTV
jgi:hypothetical protein